MRYELLLLAALAAGSLWFAFHFNETEDAMRRAANAHAERAEALLE